MKLKRVITILFVVTCVSAASALAAQISVEPVDQEVYQGENVTIDIKVYPEESAVYGASYTLYFDNTLLKATSLPTPGPFLSQDGQSTNVFVNAIDNTLGRIEYAESRTGTVAGVNDSGVLTTITFQAIGVNGVSPLDISDLEDELLYSTSGPISTDINNGTCGIKDMIPAPTPATQPTTTTITTIATPAQTPTTTSITPTPTATAIQTPTILSNPSQSPTIITSPTPVASTPPSEEKSEENDGLSGFKAIFTIAGLLAVLILIRNNARKLN